ncbi:amidase signature domain-containing protein [Apiosordaria backusii]|uniref:Amidase signature domain-containing protein n=1 Tax=Apiosordaria backusii TaxID=314023 RepID=A0AA40EGP6_9PEZI|nr:amidase signature domain-containing protein [Apiosordaria backusii]
MEYPYQFSIDPLLADVKVLQDLLASGKATNLKIVNDYLQQIEKYDGYLHAVIQRARYVVLEAAATELDDERAYGKVRGPLHGIPILIKVCVLQEFSGARDYHMPSGWSALGGQTQSAYVRGGLKRGDSSIGHSNPAGSSTGSAVGVSAGYAPIALGTEAEGSLIVSAGRAALYAMKPTIGRVSQKGVVPISRYFDSVGPMTKSVYDLAVLLDVLMERPVMFSFTKYLTRTWEAISVAVLDPKEWRYPPALITPVPGAEEQMDRELKMAYFKIAAEAKDFTILADTCLGVDVENTDLNAYLEDLDWSEVRSLGDIIRFNIQHARMELPPDHPTQDRFARAEWQNLSSEGHAWYLKNLRRVSRDVIAEPVFNNGIDVIIGPADGLLSTLAVVGGYPIAAMPLSYLEYNGRPFGAAAMAARGREDILIKVMSAWEATFPAARQPPPELDLLRSWF